MKTVALMVLASFLLPLRATADSVCAQNYVPAVQDAPVVAWLASISGAYRLGSCQVEVRVYRRCMRSVAASHADINAEILLVDLGSGTSFYATQIFNEPRLKTHTGKLESDSLSLRSVRDTLRGQNATTIHITKKHPLLQIQATESLGSGKTTTKTICEGIAPLALNRLSEELL